MIEFLQYYVAITLIVMNGMMCYCIVRNQEPHIKNIIFTSLVWPSIVFGFVLELAKKVLREMFNFEIGD